MAREGNRFQFQHQEDTTSSTSNTEKNKNVQIRQHAENPGLILVPSVLTGENYFPWSKAIKRALIAKEKLRFITEDKLK